MNRQGLGFGLISACAALSTATAGSLEDADAAQARGDRAEALRLIRPLAEQGLAEAQPLLGKLFYSCDGALQGYAEAALWFRKAAEQDNRLAQFNLANLYYFGRGVARDHVEAAKWYRKAADQGVAAAQLNLGYMYENGQGVPRDYALAHMWLDFAAARQNMSEAPGKAARMRDTVIAKMTQAQVVEAQKLARDWVSGKR